MLYFVFNVGVCALIVHTLFIFYIMTNEEKQLLLKDLCGRLLYSVKCNALLKQIDGSLKSVFGTLKGYNNGWAIVGNNLVDIETVKPYLRPLSSMTEEEKKEQYKFSAFNNVELFDWLNVHHFDYRGLIEKGLALEAPKEMYA